MDIVVVLELDTPTNVRLLGPDREPAYPDNPVRRAHTAPAEASGACGPLTLCGLDTSDMTLAPHRYPHSDQPPSGRRWHTCTTCRTAGPDTAPASPGTLTAGSHEGDTHPVETPAR
ncbi:hypothetical protein [Kitasatospora sp. NPDC059327]|uniref:hypothetical protein n=1 Tax=Kitasatospora sp. NPDC059327 TaxID=3346803 RepID=UPI0036A255B5